MMKLHVFEITHAPYFVDSGFMGAGYNLEGPTYVAAPTAALAVEAFTEKAPEVEIKQTAQHMEIDILVRVKISHG